MLQISPWFIALLFSLKMMENILIMLINFNSVTSLAQKIEPVFF